MEFIPCDDGLRTVVIKNLPQDYVNSVKTTTKIPSEFSYATLEWIRQKLLDEKKIDNNNNPVELIRACSYFLLNELAWEVYALRVLRNEDRASMLKALDEKMTFIPPLHLRRRLHHNEQNNCWWSMDIVTTDDRWFHYEEGANFVFRRKVGHNFSPIKKCLYFDRGTLIDTYGMKIIALPVETANMLFIRRDDDDLLYFIREEKEKEEEFVLSVFTCHVKNTDECTLFYQHRNSVPYSIDSSECISLKYVCHIDVCEVVSVNYRYSLDLVFKCYDTDGVYLYRVTMLDKDIFKGTCHRYYLRGEDPIISNAIHPIGSDIFYIVDNMIEIHGSFYNIQEEEVKALYLHVDGYFVGVYTENEYLNCYKMLFDENNVMKKSDFIRGVKGFNEVSFDKIKKIYSEDSTQPWMILRKVKIIDRKIKLGDKNLDKEEIWPPPPPSFIPFEQQNSIWLWEED